MTTDNFFIYLQNTLIQTSQKGGQQYSDISPLVFPDRAIHLKKTQLAWRNLTLTLNVARPSDHPSPHLAPVTSNEVI
jgi:hypothetical protein